MPSRLHRQSEELQPDVGCRLASRRLPLTPSTLRFDIGCQGASSKRIGRLVGSLQTATCRLVYLQEASEGRVEVQLRLRGCAVVDQRRASLSLQRSWSRSHSNRTIIDEPSTLWYDASIVNHGWLSRISRHKGTEQQGSGGCACDRVPIIIHTLFN